MLLEFTLCFLSINASGFLIQTAFIPFLHTRLKVDNQVLYLL